jgi:hypothetical protein
VLICVVPDTWKPTSFHSLPVEILSARFYTRGQTIVASLEIAKAYNRERLRPGKWDATWAVFCRTLKTRNLGAPARVNGLIPRPDSAAGEVEGGGI